MGTVHAAPKKLVAGMKVVVWIRPHIKLFISEFSAGIRVGKWNKGVFVAQYKGFNGIETAVNINAIKCLLMKVLVL
ncbi:hypothetical protein [Edaphovirga cremea]|uniref:hypothetical protein n=1 Tax=Edaphovirga cremea TaxID=2267246 RepID=UPI003989169E